MKNLNDMMVFATVVEKGSFTAAALAFDLPKSNISRKINRLEQNIGARLLERSTRSQHLTEVGKVYYNHCLRIQEEMQSAALSVETLMASPKGQLNICTSIAVGQGLLSPILGAFQQSYPQVQIKLQLTNRRVDIIEEGFDLVLRVGELPDSNLMAKRLCTREIHLYARPGYLKCKQVEAHLDDTPERLLQLDCLYMNQLTNKARWQLTKQPHPLNKKPTPVTLDFTPTFYCDDFTVLCRLTQDGAGIAALPDYIAREALTRGELIRVLPQWRSKKVDIYALYPSHKGAMPKLRTILDYLAEQLN